MAHAINLNDYADHNVQTGFFARLRKSLSNYRAYLAVHEELDALSDRDLADLGLSRLNVRDVARNAVYFN